MYYFDWRYSSPYPYPYPQTFVACIHWLWCVFTKCVWTQIKDWLILTQCSFFLSFPSFSSIFIGSSWVVEHMHSVSNYANNFALTPIYSQLHQAKLLFERNQWASRSEATSSCFLFKKILWFYWNVGFFFQTGIFSFF